MPLPTLLLVLAPLLQSQAAPIPAAIREARAHLSRGAHEEALAVLEELVLEDDSNASAWMLMGRAFEGLGAWEDAVGVYDLAAADGNLRGEALYASARVQAGAGLVDEALDALEACLAAGVAGPARFWHVEAFAALRDEPRFRALVPPMVPSAKLFTEEPRVIHTFYGEGPGDVFGWIGRERGDADGDGISDLLISAPYRDTTGEVEGGGPSGGKVYVYSGASGALLFEHAGRAGEVLGIGIESAGDVDGDGRMDALCGAANVNVGPGRALVLSGKDGSVLHDLTRGVHLDAYGRKVSGGVDLDGDGHDDFLVGAPGAGPQGQLAGSAFVHSGRTGEVLASVDGERAGDLFGAGNAMWGDGERALLAIGAGNAGPGQRGRVYVYRWEEGALVPAFTIESDATGAALGGMFVSFNGDFDGDGVSDVYASDWQNGAAGASSGRIYVHSGQSGERLFTMTGERAGIGFGTCTADVCDVTGDGVADLLVGAWQEPSGARGGGKCYLYSGADRSLLTTYTCTAPGETLGFDTTGVGDVDGDGGIDFLITGGYSNVAGPRSGRAFVIAGPVFDER